MAEFTLELSINNKIETREIEADGVAVQDENKDFIVFYNDVGDNTRKTLISYNLAYILSMVREDDPPRPLQ